jgi:hypothetical protein
MKAKLSQIKPHSCYLISLGSNISLLALYSQTLNQRSFIGRPRHKWGDNIQEDFEEYRILVNWVEVVEKLDLPKTFVNITVSFQVKQPTRCALSCKIFYCLKAVQHVSGKILSIIRSTFELQPQPPVPV